MVCLTHNPRAAVCYTVLLLLKKWLSSVHLAYLIDLICYFYIYRYYHEYITCHMCHLHFFLWSTFLGSLGLNSAAFPIWDCFKNRDFPDIARMTFQWLPTPSNSLSLSRINIYPFTCLYFLEVEHWSWNFRIRGTIMHNKFNQTKDITENHGCYFCMTLDSHTHACMYHLYLYTWAIKCQITDCLDFLSLKFFLTYITWTVFQWLTDDLSWQLIEHTNRWR